VSISCQGLRYKIKHFLSEILDRPHIATAQHERSICLVPQRLLVRRVRVDRGLGSAPPYYIICPYAFVFSGPWGWFSLLAGCNIKIRLKTHQNQRLRQNLEFISGMGHGPFSTPVPHAELPLWPSATRAPAPFWQLAPCLCDERSFLLSVEFVAVVVAGANWNADCIRSQSQMGNLQYIFNTGKTCGVWIHGISKLTIAFLVDITQKTWQITSNYGDAPKYTKSGKNECKNETSYHIPTSFISSSLYVGNMNLCNILISGIIHVLPSFLSFRFYSISLHLTDSDLNCGERLRAMPYWKKQHHIANKQSTMTSGTMLLQGCNPANQ